MNVRVNIFNFMIRITNNSKYNSYQVYLKKIKVGITSLLAVLPIIW